MSSLRFVPQCSKPSVDVLQRFRDVLASVNRFLVLTGAGISTESGDDLFRINSRIPDYRSEKVGQYARSNHRPMDHSTFMKSEKARQRYWSRNAIAWPLFSKSEPNATHYQIAKWEMSDRVREILLHNDSRMTISQFKCILLDSIAITVLTERCILYKNRFPKSCIT
ncbi:unnamed protein product [Anisakis simplex]|uniref:NAD-dependent protein deacetylase sirtuin-4 (inferred by orthology to a human protein) n=1 Tax=Anisakis simplex TaxID=6269 RepID=A0A0M3JBW0_ANISI|nr:unnamed protein product [Anisakis simplex]